MNQPLYFIAIIPFFNEEEFLANTLDSWAKQTRLPDAMLLLDNASTDHSPQIAKEFNEKMQGKIACQVIRIATPGKVNALHQSHYLLTKGWAVYCDADTFYPPEYLERIEIQIRQASDKVVCVMAIDLPTPPDQPEAKSILNRKLWAARIFPHRCHTGGFGQVFRTDALQAVGGFDPMIWSFVLMDHEIVQRLHTQGSSLYHESLWCIPSQRRGNRKKVRWTVWERIMYFIHPRFLERWFFQVYLRRKFSQRGLVHLNLREQPWKKD